MPESWSPKWMPNCFSPDGCWGGVNAEELTNQAVCALEQGFTGVALQQLAGLTRPSLSDLGTLPERAFADLGLQPITRRFPSTCRLMETESLAGSLLCSLAMEPLPEARALRFLEHKMGRVF